MNAEGAVGEWHPDDWRIAPRVQAKTLPVAARQLTDVLTGSALEAIKQNHDLADRDAVTAQREYKLYGRWAIYLYSAAAIFGALVGAAMHPLIGAFAPHMGLPIEIIEVGEGHSCPVAVLKEPN